ncbi:hypothetical protein [Cellulomonas endophytica]|uniref:hypothetical protein n=1 Tax=Cellulomonas endophytica TaxID=2494735 RepID=UPI0010117A7A|nr:hypothetical protein [Cellulomonas endophytica]
MAIKDLRLDRDNPRIPEGHRRDSQEDLAVLLEMGFDAFQIAQSLADSGYFQAEPLLAVPGEEAGTLVVVEGNRRLTALLGLAVPSIRAAFAEPAPWEALGAKAGLHVDTLVPVVVHASRDETHGQVARAHIVGKRAWSPYMQARYIDARVKEGRSLAEVAELIGVSKSKAADLFRDYAVVQQAQTIGIETSEVEKAFSLLTLAMGNTKLRDHLGAPLGSRMDVNEAPVPADKVDHLAELLSWTFGNESSEPVITDSRQISQLGNVVASDVGLQALRSGADLETAKEKVQQTGMDPRDRLQRRLGAAKSSLSAATADIADFASDQEVRAMVADLETLVESLRTALDELAATPG